MLYCEDLKKMTFSPSNFNKTPLLNYVSQFFKTYSKVFSLDKMKDIKMLDIGTGPGHVLLDTIIPLLPCKYSEILAIDRSEEMIEFFNTLPKDKRISGKVLDIETKNPPKDLFGKFDFLFSSYVFQYSRNLSIVFENASKFMKPNAELFFIWSKISHIPEAYSILHSTEKWKPYTSDFKNFKNPLKKNGSLGLLKTEFDKVNLKILKCEENTDINFYADKIEDFYDYIDALDFISSRIPKIDLEKYKEDFRKATCKDFIIVENGTIKLPIPSIIVGAKKIV